MARKKKQPATKVVAISLTTEDKAAMGVQLANVIAQVDALRTQKAEEAAKLQKLIDEQLDIAAALGAQLRGGTVDRDQASLKVGEDGSLAVPDKPFEDKPAEVTDEDRARIDAEKQAEGLRVPPAVADAIAKSGGEVDLSAAKAKNGKASNADAPKGKKQPPAAPKTAPVTITAPPPSCPDCGGKVEQIDPSGVYLCLDSNDLGCKWTAVVESQEATAALGAIGA